jgi:hypothetical protein
MGRPRVTRMTTHATFLPLSRLRLSLCACTRHWHRECVDRSRTPSKAITFPVPSDCDADPLSIAVAVAVAAVFILPINIFRYLFVDFLVLFGCWVLFHRFPSQTSLELVQCDFNTHHQRFSFWRKSQGTLKAGWSISGGKAATCYRRKFFGRRKNVAHHSLTP